MADARKGMTFPTPPRRVIDMPSTPAQQAMPVAPPVAPPVAQPAPVTPTRRVTPAAREEESILTVGRNIRLKGQISACDILVVEGHVEASINCKRIEVAADGVFTGKAEVETAEIHGHVEGELMVNQTLRVHPGGQVDGCIRYGTLEVAPGGCLAGDVGMHSADDAPAATGIAPHPVLGSASQQRHGNDAPPQSDQRLARPG